MSLVSLLFIIISAACSKREQEHLKRLKISFSLRRLINISFGLSFIKMLKSLTEMIVTSSLRCQQLAVLSSIILYFIKPPKIIISCKDYIVLLLL